MKHLKLYNSVAEADKTNADTPFVSIVDGVNGKVLYVSPSVGNRVIIIDDNDGFITYEQIQPNDEIWYTSSDGNVVTYSGTPQPLSNTYVKGKVL